MSQFTNFTFSTSRSNLVEFVKEIDPDYTTQKTKSADFYRAANLRLWARERCGLFLVDGTIEQDSANHDAIILSVIHNGAFHQLTIAV